MRDMSAFGLGSTDDTSEYDDGGPDVGILMDGPDNQSWRREGVGSVPLFRLVRASPASDSAVKHTVSKYFAKR